MNSLKKEIDSSFKDYEFKSGFDELYIRYKKRKRKLQAFLSSFSAVFIVLLIFLGFSTDMFGISPKSKLSLKVSAITVGNPEAMISSEKMLVSSSSGVTKQTKKVPYDKNGVEIIDGKKAKQYFNRTVIVPSPINLKITADNLESLKAQCKENGSLYNEKYDNINAIAISFKSGDCISWIPNCNKLSKSLKADIYKVPSTLTNDKLITSELNSLIKTEKDYNAYFSDTVTLTAKYKDKTEETVIIKITLDETGRYYISIDK